nr:GSU2403 family nucleotidyltransferase fold protein [Tabrizicola aquatica]
MQRHSLIANSAYLDLLRSLLDEQASTLRGTPTREIRNGRAYWYDVHRVGSSVRKAYIGEDTPDLSERLTRASVLAKERKARNQKRTELVRTLRACGMLSTDASVGSFLLTMERLGVFRLGGTLVGTQAFRLYEGELGIRIPGEDLAQTGDMDIAQFERLSLALGDEVEAPLAEGFQALDFAQVPSLGSRSIWKWRQTRSDLLVEFLTPSFRPEEDIRDLPSLGVEARSLHFLNFLIAGPIKAVALYRSGVLVQIPRPERYAVHKLIVADRRRAGADQLKSRKDRAQAALLVEALAEDRPDELREAYEDAMTRGPQWRAHIGATLARMPETAQRIAAL